MLLNVSEQSSKLFQSHRNKIRFVQQLKGPNLVEHTLYDAIDIFTCEYNAFIFKCEGIMFSFIIIPLLGRMVHPVTLTVSLCICDL